MQITGDIFDTILDEDAIIKRAEMVTEKYGHFIELGRRRLLGLKVDDYGLYIGTIFGTHISKHIRGYQILCIVRM